jgi:hypothetical protein
MIKKLHLCKFFLKASGLSLPLLCNNKLFNINILASFHTNLDEFGTTLAKSPLLKKRNKPNEGKKVRKINFV